LSIYLLFLLADVDVVDGRGELVESVYFFSTLVMMSLRNLYFHSKFMWIFIWEIWELKSFQQLFKAHTTSDNQPLKKVKGTKDLILRVWVKEIDNGILSQKRANSSKFAGGH